MITISHPFGKGCKISSAQLMMTNPFGGQVFYKPWVSSTMDFQTILCPWDILLSSFQLKGRGQYGRSWDSSPNQNWLFSLLLPIKYYTAPKDPPILTTPTLPLTLSLALGVCFFLQNLGFHPAIKWPNDVLVDHKKICGILCQKNPDTYLAGIGFNVLQKSFSTQATSLSLLSCNTTQGLWLKEHRHLKESRSILCPNLLNIFQAFLLQLKLAISQPNQELLTQLTHLLYQRGDETTIYYHGQQIQGIIDTISLDGSLIIDIKGHKKTLK